MPLTYKFYEPVKLITMGDNGPVLQAIAALSTSVPEQYKSLKESNQAINEKLTGLAERLDNQDANINVLFHRVADV